MLYRFRLEGFDRDWIDAETPGRRNTPIFPPAPTASSWRRVNADGVSSAAPATLDVHIDAPVYRRPWFYLLLALLVAALAYGIYRLRLRRVQGEFNAVLQERNRIAREIHDTLAQDFVAVSLQLEVTSQCFERTPLRQRNSRLTAPGCLVRDGIRDARESIWALRAGQSGEICRHVYRLWQTDRRLRL